MKNVLIVGGGKIGSLAAILFAESGDFNTHVVDLDFSQPDNLRLKKHPDIHCHSFDINDEKAIDTFFKSNKIDAIISCLPYFCTLRVAEIAKTFNLHYFDLTEDVVITEQIRELSQDSDYAYVPQCGLAPGIIEIIANSLMKNFDSLDSVKLRVGALPESPNNVLKYALTWSTDGLINEYGNLCHAIKHGECVELQPLEGLESISIDGLDYECFNTSGGLGDLATTYVGKVNNLTYKSIRYPGHCYIMKMLLNGLKLNQDRDTLKRILENAIPRTFQDVVIVYVSVVGTQQEKLIEECYLRKIYSDVIAGDKWGAIQITTAGSLAAVVDIVLSNPEKYAGFVKQEFFSLDEITQTRFGKIYINH